MTFPMKYISILLFTVCMLCSIVTTKAQTEFVFEEKAKTNVIDDEGSLKYDDSFQSLGIIGAGMKDGDTPVRWFVTLQNNSLLNDDTGLYLEQQIMLQVAGNTPYTFLGNGLFWYIAGTKKLGLIGKANVGVSFVSDIRNSSLFGSAIMGFGSTIGLGFSGGEGKFGMNAMLMLHQTTLAGGQIVPAGNVNFLFRL